MNQSRPVTADELAAVDRLLIEALSQADNTGLPLVALHIGQARHALGLAEQNINQLDFWGTSIAPAACEEKHHE